MTLDQQQRLRDLWPSDLGIKDLARVIGCRTQSVSEWGRRLGLGPRTAVAARAREKWARSFALSAPARRKSVGEPSSRSIATAERIAALYAGARYQDDPRAVAECGGRPWRPASLLMDRSYVGCAAAMTEGA